MGRSLAIVLALLHALVGVGAVEKLYARSDEAGDAGGQCGDDSGSVAVNDRMSVCIGFEDGDYSTPSKNGTKAVFYPKVDQYSTITVDTLEPIVSRRNTAAVAPYRYMWVGVNGKRTIGQRRGVIDRDDDCVPTDRDPAAEAADKAGLKTCYGWGFHNKPVVNDDHMMITAITALIHLDRGRISRIQWEETCNLCPSSKDRLMCLEDNTTQTCGGEPGDCRNCYLSIGQGCGPGGVPCAPMIYIAWLGTDKDGRNLLSSGSLLSRFSQHSLIPVYDAAYAEVREVTGEDDD